MKLQRAALCFTLLALFTTAQLRAADEPKAVLDKAIEAVGGAKKLGDAKAYSWKTKGKLIFDGNENPFTTEVIFQDPDHAHSKFSGEFGGNKVEGTMIINGDKGWRVFAGMKMPLEGEMLANEKRNMYLQVVPALLVPLQAEGFQLKGTGESDSEGKKLVRIKATGPDGKDFTLFFDAETHLPAKQTADVIGFMGEEFRQDTLFSDYKDFDGIQKATKIEQQRDGQTYLIQEVTEFKALSEVPAETFSEPK